MRFSSDREFRPVPEAFFACGLAGRMIAGSVAPAGKGFSGRSRSEVLAKRPSPLTGFTPRLRGTTTMLVAATVFFLSAPCWGVPAEGKNAGTSGRREQPPVLSEFLVKRGVYAEADFGAFVSFGGVNTRAVDLPTRTFSTPQTYAGVVLGWDLAHGAFYSFALGLRTAFALNGGAGRVSDSERSQDPNIRLKPSDFLIWELGLHAAFAWMLGRRIAWKFRVDGGGAVLSPDPALGALESGAGGSRWAPAFGVGTGVEYYTLLTDFSVGLSVRFVGVLREGLIPGMTVSVPLKYAF